MLSFKPAAPVLNERAIWYFPTVHNSKNESEFDCSSLRSASVVQIGIWVFEDIPRASSLIDYTLASLGETCVKEPESGSQSHQKSPMPLSLTQSVLPFGNTANGVHDTSWHITIAPLPLLLYIKIKRMLFLKVQPPKQLLHFVSRRIHQTVLVISHTRNTGSMLFT